MRYHYRQHHGSMKTKTTKKTYYTTINYSVVYECTTHASKKEHKVKEKFSV